MLIVSQCAVAQNGHSEQIRSVIDSYLKLEASKANVSGKQELEWIVSDAYLDNATGNSFAYIQQRYHGIPIFNSVSVFVIKDDEVIYGQPRLNYDLSGPTGSTSQISPENAIYSALKHLKRERPAQLTDLGNSKKGHLRFEANDVSASPIVAHLTWVSFNETLVLAWNIDIEMKDEPHWWSIRVDALTGDFIEKNDFTVNCSFSESGYHAHSCDEQTTIDDRLLASPAAPSPPGPAYNVYPLPVESPTFGSRSLLTNPADNSSSPFGWHDTNGASGAEYTITRGNNVYTYEDADNDNLPGYSPDGGGSLNFDFSITPNVAPTVNTDAALTNMFVQTNVVHDVLHHLGFDEAAGNFQENNYGNGGAAGDVILAEGFDGSGTNNANFSTPPDGSSPRMQMYLWNSVPSGCASLNIASASFTGSMTVGTGDFTASGSVTADLILANDGVGTTSDACTNIANSVTGKIVVIDRGSCSFVSKAQRAEAAGATGVIIVNNVAGIASNMTGSPVVGIPCLSVSQADGDILKAALLAGTVQGTLIACAAETFDSNFDNGIIVHEFGHGVSSRLTGGPSQASCLTNVEQANEGWSDWLALMLTIEPGDVGSDARGVGSYVMNQAATGGGIRRFPYSTDMSVNPQTYGNLATSANIHQKGEIWCDAVWDMSWLLMDDFGFSSDPTLGTAGNNIAIRLVLTGMKLQPCSPGFLDSRDGILAADALLYGSAHKALIWQAFARRGMGCSAAQGSANAIGDETEAFDEPETYYLDADDDGFGNPSSVQLACSQPFGYVTNADDCDDSDNQFGPCIMWTGTTNSIWETGTNWLGNVIPNEIDDVLISSIPTNQPHISSAPGSPAVCNNLKIQSGILTVNSGKALTINGKTINDGTILIKADATGIGSLITNGTITGAGVAQMEQYLTGSGGATPNGLFYYVSNPVEGATTATFNLAIGNKLWYANEMTQGYVQLSTTPSAMPATVGYVARMGATGVVTFSGSKFNTGSYTTAELDRTGTTEVNRGYNLMGNPYPSTVNWNMVVDPNLETSIWFRVHNLSNSMTFDTYNTQSGIGTNNNGNGDVSGFIAPTQGFWVRVKLDGYQGQFDFTNAMRSHGTLAGIYKVAAEEGMIRIALSDGTVSDEQIVMFNPSAQSGYEDFDSQKFWSSNVPQLYSNLAEDTLTINGLNNPLSTPTVDLGVKVPAQGDYTLNATSITFTETPVHLEDRMLGFFQDLNVNPVYAFTSDAGNIGDRFVLHFSTITAISEAENNINVFSITNALHVNLSNAETGTITVLDMSGRTVHNQAINSDRTVINLNTAAGIYVVQVETSAQTITQKISIQ